MPTAVMRRDERPRCAVADPARHAPDQHAAGGDGSAAGVLRPGGVLAGCGSRLSLRFRPPHIGATMVVVDPATLPDRLATAGVVDVKVSVGESAIRIRAHEL